MTFRPIAVSVFFLISQAPATTYHVSSSGSDQADGRSQTSAWATLTHAKTVVRSGDTLLLQRGSTFRESVSGWRSDLTIRDYGNAGSTLPTISGAVAIGTWNKYNNGPIYSADCPQKIAYLFVNDSLMRFARYPDTGWLRIDTMVENADGTNSIISDAGLSAHQPNTANCWSGANVRWRRWSWWFETRTVTSYEASGRLHLAAKSLIPLTNSCAGWGYYLDNTLTELNAPGEWYLDTAAHKVYLYAPRGVDPNTVRVEGSILPWGLDLSQARIERIRFSMFTDAGLRVSGTSTVDGCRFENIGSDNGGAALQATWEISNARISNCVFADNFNLAISWNENTAHTTSVSFIENDTLLNTGCVPGYGGSGSWHAAGIIISNGKNVHIQRCYIKNTGYAGIILGSERNFVEYNLFDHTMATLNDGGAIYTNCHRSTIRHNIILNTEGNLVSSGPWANLGHAIWPEFLGDFRENVISYNTCAYSGGFGIFLPNNFADTLRGNVLYGNARAQLDCEGDSTNSQTGRTQNLPQAHVIDSNICVGTAKTQAALFFLPGFDFGTFRGNYFCNPWRGDSVIAHWGTGNQRWNTSWKTISQWQAAFPWADRTATTDPVKRPAGLSQSNPFGTTRLIINDAPQPKTFDLGPGAYRDLRGAPVPASITVPAYYSTVLVRVDSGSAVVNAKKTSSIFDARWIMNYNAAAPVFYFRLTKPGTVYLNVFDLTGRSVIALVKHHQSAGPHSLTWDQRVKTARNGVLLWEFSTGDDDRATGKLAFVY